MRYRLGYSLWEMEGESCHCGGVVVVWLEEAGLQVNGMDKFGPIVVSFLLALVAQRWYIIRAYVPPNNVPAIRWV